MSVESGPIFDASDPLDWRLSDHNDMTVMQAKSYNTSTQVAQWFGLVFTASSAAIYRYQVEGRRSFLHEHPWLARSWSLECIADLENMPGV